MDTSKIIIGTVGGGRYTVTAPIVKEDYGLYLKIEGLELPSTYEVDFSNSEHNGTSVTMIGNADGVLIPSQFIASGKDVFAFLYHVGADYGRTVYKFRIPNKLRPDRTDETPTPEEQSLIDQAISALNSAVEQTAQDVIDADASAQFASENAEQAQESARTAGLYSDTAQTYANSAEISANSASASATASAQSASQSAQIKDDVEGMVDDAQASASASAQSASASATSASQASGYAQSASASAQSASGYASSAQTSANTASSKATEASGYASTASAKASEASQSATTASNKASEASGYATSASQAKTDAESARDSAQGYASDAQGYANDAQASAESVSASASQIAQNTADILKAFPTDTASGAVASFTDGADNIPLKSLIVNIDPVQDTSSGDPSPENICPISGWTQVNVEQSGVNVWDEEWELGDISSSTGQNEPASTVIRSKNYIPIKPNTEYFFNLTNGGISYVARPRYYDKNKAYIGTGTTVRYNSVFVTPVNAYYMRFTPQASYGTTYNHDISINYPSTDHSYHPYTGRSIIIDLGQTVYGGHLDVISGKLVVDMAMVDLGTLSYGYDSVHKWFVVRKSDAKGSKTDRVNANVISDTYTVYPRNTLADDLTIDNAIGLTSSSFLIVRNLNYTNTSDFITAMNGHQLVYELATPLTIQLDSHAINSLYGVNNIFADTGDCEVEYRADTKLYIEKLTQPEEDDMVANSAIASGQFFMIGNSLYRALANIASGATITVGTNAQRVSLADALNLINT